MIAAAGVFAAELLGFVNIPGFDLQPVRKSMPFTLKNKAHERKGIKKKKNTKKNSKKGKKTTKKTNKKIPAKKVAAKPKPKPKPKPIPKKPEPKKIVKQPEPKAPEKPKKTEPSPEDKLKYDPILGAKKIAKLWNQMEIGQLLPIAKEWKDLSLAQVMVQMDQAKAAELLGSFEANRAAELSKLIQKEASIVKKK